MAEVDLVARLKDVVRISEPSPASNSLAAGRLAVDAAKERFWQHRQAIIAALERAERLEKEIERLHTWAGLMSVLDEHYPADVFDGSSGDPGPRIVALIREINGLRAAALEGKP